MARKYGQNKPGMFEDFFSLALVVLIMVVVVAAWGTFIWAIIELVQWVTAK